MGQVIMPSVQGATTLEEVKNTVGIMIKELSWLLNNLDTRNVNEIDGDILVRGTVTAEKMIVEELSAISANMGKLTSGEIYGAYIATRENAYPRAELSNEEDLFAAYKSETEYIKIESMNVANASPQIEIISGANGLYLNQFGVVSRLYNIGNRFDVTVRGDLVFTLFNPFDSIRMDFVQLLDSNTSKTLYQQLLGKADVEEAGYNLTFDGTTRNLKMFNKSGGLMAQVNIPK